MTIELKNISLEFRKYNNGFPSLKSYFLDLTKFKKPKYSNFIALNKINLKINNGDRIGVIGDNGAGKSTLLKLISGIYTPSKGIILVEGKVAPLLEIGSGFHPELSGRENLRLNLGLLGFSLNETKSFEEPIIEFSGIREFIDVQVKYYSTGMNLRLGFSIMSSIEPDILLIDEFFAGGDKDFINKSSNRLEQMIFNSRILIMVSHQLEYIEKFCNKVLWLKNGNINSFGDTKTILKNYIAN